MVKVSIFVPVYNEEKIIRGNIKKIVGATRKFIKNFEIIVVNDASTDGTLDELKKVEGIKILNYNNGPTRRENLAQSFKKAKGDIIAFMDADLSVDLRYLKELICNVENGADIAIGSRYGGLKAKRESKRLVISFVYNKIMRILFLTKIKDHQCGFKAFKRELLPIISGMGFDNKRGWFWDVEFLARAKRAGYKIKEFPILWVRSERKSSFNIKRELRMIPYVISLRFKGFN